MKTLKRNVLVVFMLGTLISYSNENITSNNNPIVKVKKSSIFISKKNVKNKEVKILLYYNEELIYSNTFKEKGNLKKVFRLLESEKGTYKIVMHSNNETYSKEIEL